MHINVTQKTQNGKLVAVRNNPGLAMLAVTKQVCEFWQRTARACWYPTGCWRKSEYFCASRKAQYRSILLLKKQVFSHAGTDQFVFVELQVTKSSAGIREICQHRLHEYAFLQEHPCCFKRHKQELLGHACKIQQLLQLVACVH